MVLLGVLLLMRPVEVMRFITVLVGILFLIEGGLPLVYSLQEGKGLRAYPLVIVLFGVLCIVSPIIMNALWMILLGLWQLLAGINGFAQRKNAPKGTQGMLLIVSTLSLLLGLMFILAPMTSLVAIWWILGILLLLNATAIVAQSVKVS